MPPATNIAAAIAAIAIAAMAPRGPAGGETVTFRALAFHDVVDRDDELDSSAVTAGELVRFFDWLKGNGWTAVSLDDVDAAQRGRRPLPGKSVLLTFDDGRESVYSRVFPLLLAYRYPAVVALTGAWVAGDPGATVPYGGSRVPRASFVSWPEVREMAASGLVEVASHGFDLHREVPGDPQGDGKPAASTWIYDPKAAGYEDDAAYRRRIRADLATSRRQIGRELGAPPRTLAWPYGRYTAIARDEAERLGFARFLTLSGGQGDAEHGRTIDRVYYANRPTLPDLVAELDATPRPPPTTRLACVTLDGMAAAPDAEGRDARLGGIIDAIRAVGANAVIIDAAAGPPAPDAPLGAVFFPTRLRPVAADVLGRAVWRIRGRAGAQIYLRLPLPAVRAALGDARVGEIYGDLLKYTTADGLVLDGSAALLSVGGEDAAAGPVTAAEVRRRRLAVAPATFDASDRAAVDAWRAAAAAQPQLKLLLTAPADVGTAADAFGSRPAPAADLLLLPAAGTLAGNRLLAGRLREAGWLDPPRAGRVALTLPAGPADAVGTAVRDAQTEGATALALCPGDILRDGDEAALSAAFSSSAYPLRP